LSGLGKLADSGIELDPPKPKGVHSDHILGSFYNKSNPRWYGPIAWDPDKRLGSSWLFKPLELDLDEVELDGCFSRLRLNPAMRSGTVVESDAKGFSGTVGGPSVVHHGLSLLLSVFSIRSLAMQL
jgi:hypothetical protein